MHFYNFHIGDYLTHTLHLSPMEDLAYRRMIDWCYLNEKPLPVTLGKICALIRMSDHKAEVGKILREYFELTEDGYTQKRIVEEINKYQAFKTAGKRGANKRWGEKKIAPLIAPPLPPPIATKNQEPYIKNIGDKIVENFTDEEKEINRIRLVNELKNFNQKEKA
jgi:uncharacterized protein YdaU (DUF1376 family)